jgi:hypothetical protein
MAGLKQRWGITSNFQLVIIFIVFAINGSLSAKISAFLMGLLNMTRENTSWFIYYPVFLILVLPLYPFMLMAFGYIFGQSSFFLPFAKRMLKSIGLGFIFKEKKTS